MAKLKWDQSGEHYYETGVKQGVLYVKSGAVYNAGVPWNGLTAATETPSGAEETKLYADDTKYLSLRSAEEFGGTLEAYTYPDEFMQCDGSKAILSGIVLGQQSRSAFGLCYRTSVGNDIDGSDHGYKIHLLYGLTASPSERAYSTINDSPEAITFSWEFSSVPEIAPVDGDLVKDMKPVSCITIDSRNVNATKLATFEAKLYGSDNYVVDDDLDQATWTANKTHYFVRTGAIGSYSYTQCTDSDTWDATATYCTNEGNDPMLPLPQEVYDHFKS